MGLRWERYKAQLHRRLGIMVYCSVGQLGRCMLRQGVFDNSIPEIPGKGEDSDSLVGRIFGRTGKCVMYRFWASGSRTSPSTGWVVLTEVCSFYGLSVTHQITSVALPAAASHGCRMAMPRIQDG